MSTHFIWIGISCLLKSSDQSSDYQTLTFLDICKSEKKSWFWTTNKTWKIRRHKSLLEYTCVKLNCTRFTLKCHWYAINARLRRVHFYIYFRHVVTFISTELIFLTYFQKRIKKDIVPDPIIAIFEVISVPSFSTYERLCISLFMVLAKRLILQRWKHDIVPTFDMLLSELAGIIQIEKLRFINNDKLDTFWKIWKPVLDHWGMWLLLYAGFYPALYLCNS